PDKCTRHRGSELRRPVPFTKMSHPVFLHVTTPFYSPRGLRSCFPPRSLWRRAGAPARVPRRSVSRPPVSKNPAVKRKIERGRSDENEVESEVRGRPVGRCFNGESGVRQ